MWSPRPCAKPAIAPRSRTPRPARCPGSRVSTGRRPARSRRAPRACRPASIPRGSPSAPAPASARRSHAPRAGRGRSIPRAFASLEPVEEALSAALMNAGPIIPPPLILMNAGPLEHFERWDIHKEGTQPSIRRVTDALDAERIAAREKLGYRAPHFPLADHYRSDGDEWMYGRRVHKKLTDSQDWREHIALTEHRYMREDVEQGLAFLVSVCERAGVACPVARGLLALGSAVLGRDLRATGRTLENVGLGSLSAAQLKERLA